MTFIRNYDDFVNDNVYKIGFRQTLCPFMIMANKIIYNRWGVQDEVIITEFLIESIRGCLKILETLKQR